MSETLRERVARAILETDPTCDYDACKARVLNAKDSLDENWWAALHRQADRAIAEVRKDSAALDMLEALKRLCHYANDEHEDGGAPSSDDWSQAWLSARAAIKKAGGE